MSDEPPWKELPMTVVERAELGAKIDGLYAEVERLRQESSLRASDRDYLKDQLVQHEARWQVVKTSWEIELARERREVEALAESEEEALENYLNTKQRLDEASDEVERLRAENEALQTAHAETLEEFEVKNAELRAMIEVHETLAKSALVVVEVGDRLEADQESEIEALKARLDWFERWHEMAKAQMLVVETNMSDHDPFRECLWRVRVWEETHPKP
jgi:chromosome segregation ATPase